MNLHEYKRLVGRGTSSEGQLRKVQSDEIMNVTWDRDIQSKKCYMYDYYHDDDRENAENLHYNKNTTKTPVDAKFIITQYGSLSKDQVEYHIQFRPGVREVLPYYKETYGKFGMALNIGNYIDIPDDDGVYNKWLICSRELGNQFVKYNVLPCNYHFHWVYDNKKYAIWGVARLRSSYNSGLWTDYVFTGVENQDQMWLPMNEDTVSFYYDQRIIISVQELEKPITWKVSKVENIHPIGINKITLAQTKFNPETDRKIDGFWYADYAVSEVEPKGEPFVETHDTSYAKITYTGVKPLIKVGGSGKVFAAQFYDGNGNSIEETGLWSFFIGDEDVTASLKVDINGNECKVYIEDENYIGNLLTVKITNEDGTVSSEIKADIQPL